MKPATKKLLLWGLLLAMFVAIWQFLTPADRPGAPRPGEPFDYAAWTPALAVVLVLVAAFVVLSRLGAAARVHNAGILASNAHVGEGRYAEATEAVQGLSTSRLPQFRRAYHVQLALIATWQGDRDRALAELDAAVAGPVGRLFRGGQRLAILQAHSMRSFLRASAGDEPGARADIALVRAEPDVEPTLVARVTLAEARLLDEDGDRAALAALLAQSRSLLLEAGSRRERALVRAYETMLETSAASVYRRKGDRTPTSDEAAATAAWVTRFAPNAAPFVREATLPQGAAAEMRVEAPSAAARRKIEEVRPRNVKHRPRWRKLAAWTGLSTASLFFWTRLHEGPGDKLLGLMGLSAVGGVVVLWLGRSIRSSRANARRLAVAGRALRAGDLDRAARELDMEPQGPLQRAQVANQRAELAIRSGDMAEALTHCARSFHALAELQGGTPTPPVEAAPGAAVPWDLARSLAAQRALALATLGRADEAWAEIAWAKGFPSSVYVFQVRWAIALADRDYAAAAAVVDARDPALALDLRFETLAELTRFLGLPASRTAPDAARLRGELRRDRSLVRWIDGMAPGLLTAFEQAAAETEAAGAEPLPTA